MRTMAAGGVPALLLAVDFDEMTLERLRRVVEGSDLDLHSVSRKRAVERIASAPGPVVVLIGWNDEHAAEYTPFCNLIRAMVGADRSYLVAVVGVADESLLESVTAVVDDVLCRPFGHEVLLRIRHALRGMRPTSGPKTPKLALEEALRSPTGGDVAVRAGEQVGYIHVQGGSIVWANLSSAPATVDEIIRTIGIELDAEVIKAVKAECHATRTHIVEILVRWKLVDAERAREAVRAFVGERVRMLLELPDAVALFLPQVRRHTEHLRIEAAEIPSLRTPEPQPPLKLPSGEYAQLAPAVSADVTAVFQATMRLEGVVSVAVLDRKTGTSLLLSSTHEIDTAIAWTQLSSLAALGPDGEDVIAAAGPFCYVTRPIQVSPSLALFVVFEQASTTIGLARSMVARAASSWRREAVSGSVSTTESLGRTHNG